MEMYFFGNSEFEPDYIYFFGIKFFNACKNMKI